jgi:hypothetical protein
MLTHCCMTVICRCAEHWRPDLTISDALVSVSQPHPSSRVDFSDNRVNALASRRSIVRQLSVAVTAACMTVTCPVSETVKLTMDTPTLVLSSVDSWWN